MSLFGLDEASKVFLYAKPTDMRKGFDGLYGLVVEHLELDPSCGYLFVFLNSHRTRIKVLHWNVAKTTFLPVHTTAHKKRLCSTHFLPAANSTT